MIIVRNSNNHVAASGSFITLDSSKAVVDGVTYYAGISSSTCTLVDVIAPPNHKHYTYDGTDFIITAEGLVVTKDEKIEALFAKSADVSREDLTVDGVVFAADNESVADITAALSLMGRDPTGTIDFRGKSGWAVANKAALEGMQNAVWARRKAVNANTKAHEVAITLLTTAQEVLDYDITTGWT